MENERKIKEIYDCQYIVADEKLYPLQKWYNQLIDKDINEITIADVSRMMRQKIFVNLAMVKAIEFLQENIFAGELYDGEILDKISELDISFIMPYINDLEKILEIASEESVLHEWSYNGEIEEFKKVIELLLRKIEC